MPPPNPNAGLTPVNINYVWGPSDNAAQTWVIAACLARGMMVGLPLLLFWPVHILLRLLRAEARMTLASPTRSAEFRPLRFALRELRGGLHGFRIFVACIALGVMAIAGVGSFSRSLTDGLAREGRVILGGDLSFTLIHREADAAERRFLDGRGQVSAGATHAGHGAHRRRPPGAGRDQGGRRRLSAVRHGRARSRHAARPRAGAARRRVRRRRRSRRCWRGSICKPGARLTIGSATIEIAAVIKSEPDKLASGIGVRPARDRQRRGAARHRPAGARQPGALELPPAAARRQRPRRRGRDRGRATRNCRMPAGRSARRTNASPALERNVERFTQFLTLVGLTALLVGGVGVANAVKSHIDRKRDVIATLKALGASGGRVFAIYLWQVLLLSAIGAAIGLVLGAALPFAIAAAFGAIIPLPIAPALQPAELALAFGYGLLTALAFALWPLGRAHDVPVSALFRDAVVARSAAGRAGATCVAIGAGGGRARGHRGHAVLRPQDRGDLHRRRGRGVRGAAARGAAADGASRAGCRMRAQRRCGSPSPTCTGRAR